MAKSSEPLWWVPFMGGAVVSAFLMPATVVVMGVFSYFWLVTDSELFDLLQNPWVRLVLFVLIALSLFHGFHRILYILIDLGFKGARGILAVLCYGSAIVGTVVALLVVLRIWP
jgi:fumarate reductase subunit D